MAEAGIASRRASETMIRDGLVKVNGKVVIDLPVLVDPQHDTIVVQGRKLRLEPKVYFLLNKPRKVICTNADPQGRRRAIDLLTGVKERVYPVGRLDTDSQGLLILTNDGELANQLTHPRYGITKTYVADVDGQATAETINKLKKGIYLPQGKAYVENVKILRCGPRRSLLEIALREGRNRQIRLMLLRLGHKIRRLTRVSIGRLTLRGLGVGRFRPLTAAEVKALQKLTQPSKNPKSSAASTNKAKTNTAKKATLKRYKKSVKKIPKTTRK